ncbi:hypothetical protein [Ruminococcus flavefaciens]|uniref:Uncharacterized protein n=1 Tax=Ruminococcus flavefaciens 007c TaxID=1341157 RepID=W7UVL0_RUMFL|nr:hypothetical protein [Ruminococcus flavefaciens]EWM52372.1 hypothetical protein RF007C_13560 [Ruminococcus flavefaciens 007c]
MRHYSAKRILSLPRLSHLLYDDQNNFTPERLITDLGLYEGVLIDASNITMHITIIPDPSLGKDREIVNKMIVSDDVKSLHSFLLFKDNIMLPCSECRRNQPFSPVVAFNPQRQRFIIDKENEKDEAKTIKIPIEKSVKEFSFQNNPFGPITGSYLSCNDELSLSGNLSDEKKDTESAALSCVNGISLYFSEIRRDFVCSLNNDHHVTAYFIIHKAEDACKEQKQSADYEKLKYCLVLEKVGQEPSMADLQMFDIEKYKKVLSDESFRDFSMALGLHANGVGCGSLLYLRRIYETLIKNAQDKCSLMSEWDEEEYNKIKHFNDKIEYLEAFGAKIIPDELSDVKAKIYGWLSKGVHELSEQESMELFPYLKYAIELILDEQIAQKEKEEKLKELKKKLQK